MDFALPVAKSAQAKTIPTAKKTDVVLVDPKPTVKKAASTRKK